MRRGLVVILMVAGASWLAARQFSLPAVAIGIGAGILIGNAWPASRDAGTQIASKRFLLSAVVLLGFTLSTRAVADVQSHWPILAAAILVPLTIAGVLGRRWGVAIGTAICGASAIAASKEALGLDDREVTTAVATVTLLGSVGMLLIPAVATWAGMSQGTAGAWAGATLHAVPQAIGAGFAIGPEAGSLATTLKLSRVALLPVVLIVAGALARKGGKVRIPLEVIGFLGAAAWAATGTISAETLTFLGQVAKALLLVALVAMGIQTRFSQMQLGRSLAVGIVAWLATSVAVLMLV